MKYNKNVKIDKTSATIVITVTCEKKKYAVDDDYIFEEDVTLWIPENLKNKIKLIEKPKTYISNLNYYDHSTVGVWKFSIIEEKKVQKRARPSTRKKSQPTTKNTPSRKSE